MHAVQKFVISRIFYVSTAHQGCIYLIKNTENVLIYFCDAALNFQHHYFSLKCHMILQQYKSYNNTVFTVTFHPFNTPLLNKSINCFKNYWPQTFD